MKSVIDVALYVYINITFNLFIAYHILFYCIHILFNIFLNSKNTFYIIIILLKYVTIIVT